jgi:putative heme-binding domain-containing protein
MNVLARCLFFSLALPLISTPCAAQWTTSHITGSPEPAHAYTTEEVFAQVPLASVLDMVPVPGLEQWVFVQNNGQLVVTPTDVTTVQSSIALDLKALHSSCDHAYGIAFHPQFASNRIVFITYTNGDKLDDGSRLSRFKVVQDKPLRIDQASEEVIITWRSGGHNGAAMQFGTDGFIYLTTGDSEVPAPPDPLKTGQDISDLLASVLRIDVDHREAGKNYAVPKDNPFLDKPKARPEIWAYGLRNPWKISFDRVTGKLWCGDVGWEQWENVYLIERGGNYGWSAMEGNNSIFPERLGPTPISPPVVTHSHSEAASITGGFVYRGKQFPDLVGAYIYGDWETGKVWALWHDGQHITRHEEIADTPYKIVTFGQGEDGELYFAHWNEKSSLHRFIRNPQAGKTSAFPRKLSETGLFADVAKQTPAAGVLEFQVQAEMWADGAIAKRFIALPSPVADPSLNGKRKTENDTPTTAAIDAEARSNATVTASASPMIETKLWSKKDGSLDSKMTWPKDAVLAKTIAMPLEQAKPATAINIETQLLHFDGVAWNAYSYRWNDAGTDAELVGDAGDERRVTLKSSLQPEGEHSHNYRFHSRAECMRCHTMWTGFTLGIHPEQLLAPEKLIAAGLMDESFAKQSPARLVNPHDEKATLEARARSWLHANCAHCHRKDGGGAVPMRLNAELSLVDMNAIDAKPTRGDFGMSDAKIIVSGNPWSSVLLHRIAQTGTGHMPMLGTSSVDEEGVALLVKWIDSLAASKSVERNAPTDPASAVATPGQALHSAMNFNLKEHTAILAAAKASPDAHIRDLFERFLPDSERVETLGSTPKSAIILALKGDATRGAAILSPTGKAATCLACHFVKGSGRDFGPDLSHVGARLTSEQILDSLLTPSKTIAEGYAATTVTTQDGNAQLGFVVKREADAVTLKLASGQALSLKSADIASEKALPSSLMPEGLLSPMTAQEAADLVAWLASLK